MSGYRQGPRNTGPSKFPIPCRNGEACNWDKCQYLHPWNENAPGFDASRWKSADPRPPVDSGWGARRPSDSSLYYGSTGGNTPPLSVGGSRPDLVRRRTSDEQGWNDERDSTKRQRTDSWGLQAGPNWDRPGSSGSGRNTSNSGTTQPANTRFGVSSLDRDGPSPAPNPATLPGQPARDPRARPGPQRAATSLVSSNQSTATGSPALNNALGFLSPQTSTLGGTTGGYTDMPSAATSMMADARASQIIVPESGNMTLDQIRNPNEVMQFVMRRMSAAVRTNVIREDLVAKHLVLKSLKQTVTPLPVSGTATPNAKIEEQLDTSRREIHLVEQKLKRYQAEVEVGWRQLGLTIGLGLLPTMAEVRDVEGVKLWIDGLKNEMGRYLEDRIRDEVRRAEGRVAQAAASARPKDEDMERRVFELSKAMEDMRLEQAKQRRLDSGALLGRLEALEREMGERRKVDAEAQAEIEMLNKRVADVEEVFGYTRTDLDTLVERVDVIGPKLEGFDDVEKELRAMLDSAIASVPDKPTLITSIMDRLTPQVVGLLQKLDARYAEELKMLQSRMDERLSRLGLDPGARLQSDLDNAIPGFIDRSQSEGARQGG
ncbi:hypothetical protein CALVIDRAFT_567985 [Calocera viscosa TUFC12733]|uniref:C3H1-type domain-containing protein n=1 Tax=Calocera viscosa (strain TUFC12733) TaxID=1330018 RepID=A0A167HIH9_CALVF|nr:hypothetical protein CALVIDRAFT_567985 [Calocera viscosa TUFC12733]